MLLCCWSVAGFCRKACSSYWTRCVYDISIVTGWRNVCFILKRRLGSSTIWLMWIIHKTRVWRRDEEFKGTAWAEGAGSDISRPLTRRASCWNLAAFLVSATARSTKPTDWSMLLSILSIIPPWRVTRPRMEEGEEIEREERRKRERDSTSKHHQLLCDEGVCPYLPCFALIPDCFLCFNLCYCNMIHSFGHIRLYVIDNVTLKYKHTRSERSAYTHTLCIFLCY